MQTNKEKQDKRKAEMQAAAERDGFATASAAITAWKNGKARLTMRAADGAYSPRVHTASCGCVVCKSHRPANTPRR